MEVLLVAGAGHNVMVDCPVGFAEAVLATQVMIRHAYMADILADPSVYGNI